MSFRHKLWISGLSAFISLNATPVFAAGGAVADAHVVAVHMEGNEAYASFDVAINNPDGCSAVSWIVLPSTMAGRENYISMLLSAQASGKRISAWVSGCSGSPWSVTLPTVYAMQIKP